VTSYDGVSASRSTTPLVFAAERSISSRKLQAAVGGDGGLARFACRRQLDRTGWNNETSSRFSARRLAGSCRRIERAGPGYPCNLSGSQQTGLAPQTTYVYRVMVTNVREAYSIDFRSDGRRPRSEFLARRRPRRRRVVSRHSRSITDVEVTQRPFPRLATGYTGRREFREAFSFSTRSRWPPTPSHFQDIGLE
jgi:hypothetical protein